MKSRTPSAVPAQLETARQVFERWRRSRNRSWRIPERLWSRAVRLAGVHGVCQTARVLGLDYSALKKRVRGSQSDTPIPSPPSPGFVALLAPVSGVPESVVEVEEPDGTKLRVHVRGGPVADVAALVRSFRDRAR